MTRRFLAKLLTVTVLSGLLIGCQDKTTSPTSGQTPGGVEMTATPDPSQTSSNSDSSTSNSGPSGSQSSKSPQGASGSQTGSASGDEDSSMVVSELPTESMTKMNIQPGVDRMWQNAPTEEEIKQATTIKKRDVSRVGEVGGNGAPVYDDTGLTTVKE